MKGAGDALGRVAAGFAAPFPGREISFDILFRESLKANPRLHMPLPELLLRRDQTNSGMNAMITSGQKAQALRRLVEQFCLRQNAPPDGDHGIGGENESAFELFVDAHHRQCGLGLVAREPRGASPRQLALFRGFIDIGRPQRIRLDARLIDKREPAR